MYGQKLYRGFESPPLRHTVWTAEKRCRMVAKTSEIRRNFAQLFGILDRRKLTAQGAKPFFLAFFSGLRSGSPTFRIPSMSVNAILLN